MTKKTKIILAIAIFIIAMVLFLFWDKIKERLHKNDVIEVMPPATNNTNSNVVSGGSVINTSQGAPVISIVQKPKKYDVLKAIETTYMFQKGTNNIIKSFPKGATVGIYTADYDTANYYYVTNGNNHGMVKKTTVKPL